MFSRKSLHFAVRFLSLLTWSLWFGGLTVYSGFVVPIGSEQLGETTQGFVTQQVTIRLNVLGFVALALFVLHIFISRRIGIFNSLVSVIQLATLVCLVCLHPKLSSMIDLEFRSGPLDSSFYQWHQAYLIITTIQWLNGLTMLGLLSRDITCSTGSSNKDPK